MTSALGGGGVPKSWQKKQKQLIIDNREGGGVKNARSYADVIQVWPLGAPDVDGDGGAERVVEPDRGRHVEDHVDFVH